MKKLIWILSSLTMLIAPCYTQAQPLIQKTNVKQFITQQVKQHGFSRDYLIDLFKHTHTLPRVVKKIKSPYEAKPWYKYRKHFLTRSRLLAGEQFWHQHARTLLRAQKEYGVPASIIVSIIGVESHYGKHPGKYKVMNALSTLAFNYKRRARFFKKELSQYLLYCREEGIDPLSLKGSYAGAIGIPQFMPSSYRHYAVDFSGNGKRDLISNMDDVIGSIANYLKQNGWQRRGLIAVTAHVTGQRFKQLKSKRQRKLYSLTRLRHYGINPKNHLKHNNIQARLLKLRGAKGPEYWLGFHNFNVITRYNTSKLYAMAVYQFSRQLEHVYAATKPLEIHHHAHT